MLEGFGTRREGQSRAKATRASEGSGSAEPQGDVLWNRAVDQPYKVVGTWAIDQWKKIGVDAKQDAVPTGVWFSRMRQTKDHDVTTDANCQSVVNPIADVSKFLCSAGNNRANCKDQVLEDIYNKLVREGDPAKQRQLLAAFEKQALETSAQMITTLWWYKINAYRSYVKGWKISPSHYLNQHLDQVWLDK